jgi:hypothetical protein
VLKNSHVKRIVAIVVGAATILAMAGLVILGWVDAIEDGDEPPQVTER